MRFSTITSSALIATSAYAAAVTPTTRSYWSTPSTSEGTYPASCSGSTGTLSALQSIFGTVTAGGDLVGQLTGAISGLVGGTTSSAEGLLSSAVGEVESLVGNLAVGLTSDAGLSISGCAGEVTATLNALKGTFSGVENITSSLDIGINIVGEVEGLLTALLSAGGDVGFSGNASASGVVGICSNIIGEVEIVIGLLTGSCPGSTDSAGYASLLTQVLGVAKIVLGSYAGGSGSVSVVDTLSSVSSLLNLCGSLLGSVGISGGASLLSNVNVGSLLSVAVKFLSS